MRNIFKEENFRPVVAEFSDETNDLKESSAALIVKPKLRTRNGKRLARKAAGEHINCRQFITDNRKLLNRFWIKWRFGKIVAICLNSEMVFFICPRNRKAFFRKRK